MPSESPTSLNDLPVELFRSCILTTNYESVSNSKSEEIISEGTKKPKKSATGNSYFTSKELFMLRGVCGKWLDSVRITWCQIVKDEILDQVQSLDLLYEKETTSQLMEFKVKYLTSYAGLLNQYFINLNFNEVVHDIVASGDARGLIIVLITCMVVKPQEFIPPSPQEISSELLESAVNYMKSEEFSEIYNKISEIDTIPKLSFQQMRIIKTEYMDRFCQSDTLSQLTNSARIMASWLDAILEFTVLKHEALILTVKKQNIIQKIKNISIEWPKKKQFIERAYKILLFTKRVKPEINITLRYLKLNNFYDFMDKEKMDGNKVYLKIKDIERREERLLQRKKDIESCASCTSMSDSSGRPELNRIEAAMNALSSSESNPENMQPEQQVRNHVEIQTETFEEEKVTSEPQTPPVDEAVEQPIEEEKEEVTSDSEEEPEVPDEEPTYNSIRERYAKPKPKEKQESEIVDVQEESNLVQTPQTQPATIESSQLEEAEDEEETDELLPGEDPRTAQGIIQMLSSKLLCQILSAGDLFQSHIAERIEEVELMRNKYQALWYEEILKARIFLADRHEKVERALQRIGLIPKDEEGGEAKSKEPESGDDFKIEEIDIEMLEAKLHDPEVVGTIYKYIIEDDENYDV